MKYSLRSLMIVVTLACVLLGGVMGRIEYLRRWAVFHDSEQARQLIQWRHEYESLANGSGSAASEAREAERYFHHKLLARQYRQAAYRPWTVVKE
jgi:Tfp pilus assembly protein PilV